MDQHIHNNPFEGDTDVEETEPARIQSSVRPFYSDYQIYDLQDSDEETEEAEETDDAEETEEVSQPDITLQPSVREEEREHLLARSLDESLGVNNYRDDGVKLSVEETEPARIQSSVRPLHLEDSDEEAE